MATARKLPSGQYRCLAYMGRDAAGKRVYQSFTAPTKPAAEAAAAQAQLSGSVSSSARCTLGDACRQYNASKSNILSPSTLRRYQSILTTHLVSLAPMQIQRVTNTDVQRLVNQISTTVSPKTVQNVYFYLTAVFRFARPDFRLSVQLPQRVPHEMQIPERADIPRLLKAAKHNQPLYTAVLIAVSCGLRLGEICALEWSDYNKKARTLSVSKSLVRLPSGGWSVKSPKSAAGYRTLSVPQPLADHLDSLPRDRRPVPVTPCSINQAYRNARRIAGLTCRFHDLRHYYASLLLALNVPTKYAMKRMGHSTSDTLQRVYQHVMSDKDAEITATIDAEITSQLSTISR